MASEKLYRNTLKGDEITGVILKELCQLYSRELTSRHSLIVEDYWRLQQNGYCPLNRYQKSFRFRSKVNQQSSIHKIH